MKRRSIARFQISRRVIKRWAIDPLNKKQIGRIMINRRTLSFLSCLLLGAFFLATMASSAKKPNILLIISDDQGYGDFGFMGNTVLRTPQLDKLAASGAIFENYTTGVACSPGRSMLYTGRNHLSTGVWRVWSRWPRSMNWSFSAMKFMTV